MASLFNFKEKEGKWFAPVTSTKTKYIVQGGAVVADGSTIVAGIKGVYGKVRLSLGENYRGSEAELFAINTEFFPSSN